MLFPQASHKVGLGLRPAHFCHLEQKPLTHATSLEGLTEHYLDSRGRPFEMLIQLRNQYPVALHSMSLNLGSAHGVRMDFLRKLAKLAEQVEPFLISDHLCWTGTPTHHLHNLLPLPYTAESLDIVTANIDLAQSYLRRPLAIENISSYLVNENNEMKEAEFINELCRRTGCSILLDLNSLYINSVNHGFSPLQYLSELNFSHVSQVHLGGWSVEDSLLIDSRAEAVTKELWSLFTAVVPRIRHLPIIIERDRNIPIFPELEKEVQKAVQILEANYETQRNSELV